MLAQGPGQGGYARYGSNSPGASPRGGDADRNFRDDRRKDGGNRQGGENGSAGDGEHKGNMRSAGDSTLESTDGDKRKKRNGRKKGDKDSDGNGKRSSGRGDGGGNSDRRDGGANTGRQSKKKSPSFNALDFPSLADGDAGAAAVVGTTGSSSAATTPLAGAWASARLGGSREKESGASFSTAEDKGKEDEQAAAPSSRTQEGPTEGPNVRADASSNGEALVPSSTQPVNGGNVSAPQSLRGTQIASAAAGDGSQKAAAAETVAPKPTEKEVSTAGESASATVDQPADHEHVGPWGGKISFSDVVKKGK